MTDMSGFGTFSYGGVSIDVVQYSVDEKAQVKSDVGRTGTSVTVSAECEIVSASPADLATDLAGIKSALRHDGQDAIITTIGGGVEYALLATYCIAGGPTIDFKIADGPAPLTKKISITANAQLILTADNIVGGGGSGGSGGAPAGTAKDSYTVKYATDAAGMMKVTRSGELNGWLTGKHFLETVLPAMQALYPLPNWTIDSDYELTTQPDQNKLKYNATAQQLSAPLPAASSSAYSVSGTCSKTVSVDEQSRRTTNYSYNLLVVGDPAAVASSLRPAGKVIRNESLQITTIPETRISQSFQVIEPSNGNGVLSWSETVVYERDDPTYEVKTYPGADPLIVQLPRHVKTVSQSGSATGSRVFISPGEPLYPGSLLSKPKIGYACRNKVEWETTWSYLMVVPQSVSSERGPKNPYDGVGDVSPGE